MADLIALGKEGESWRRTLPAKPVTLGRTAKSDWDVPWDKQISGVHATLTWQGGRLLIRKEPSTLNAIFVKGAKANDEFSLAVGEQFVIGGTTFSLQESEAPLNLTEMTCSRQELQQVKFTDADKRIEVLAALPGIIRYSPSKEELESRVVDVLLRGIPARTRRRSCGWTRRQARPIRRSRCAVPCGASTAAAIFSQAAD